MAVTLPNSGITIPDEGNRSWYAMFVTLMTLLDTASAADDYLVPGSTQHVGASMAALFDDLYSRYYVLATTTPFDVEAGGDSVVMGALSVIARL